MTDDMLRAVAKNGGVVSVNFYPGFINRKDAGSANRLIQKVSRSPDLTGAALGAYARKMHFEEMRNMKPAAASIDDVVAHIEHAVKVAGIDHVGIGSDFDGIDSVPRGLEDISKMPKLAALLKKKGYSDADIQKIWGGNVLRVIRAVVGQFAREEIIMRKALLTALLVSLSGMAIAQPQATVLKEPAGWRFERLPIPPQFAPGIKLTGFEEVRFAPGMFDTSSDTYFTCALVIVVDGAPEFDQAAITDFLEKYYRGLSLGVGQRKGMKPDPAQMEARGRRARAVPGRWHGKSGVLRLLQRRP